MLNCITVDVKYLHINDYDVFNATPFIKKRYQQLVEEGLIVVPLQARKIKTHDTHQHYKLLDANYKLNALKKLGEKEIAIIVHPLMSEDIARESSLRLANDVEIINKESVNNSLKKIKEKYTSDDLMERLGMENLIPLDETYDIPLLQLSQEEIDSFDMKIPNNIKNPEECPTCGCSCYGQKV